MRSQPGPRCTRITRGCARPDIKSSSSRRADHAWFKALRERDRRAYNVEKKRLRERMIAVVERDYVPGLSKHIAMQVMGTPVTNERFCTAPFGYAYGSVLTPKNVGRRVPSATPFRNLWLVNASAGFPSIGGTVKAGIELADGALRDAQT